MHVSTLAKLLVLTLVLGGAAAGIAEPAPSSGLGTSGMALAGLAGKVSHTAGPLGSARVYAYQLADLSLSKVMTDRDGNFLFTSLPGGLYKVIAFKSGFLPAVVMLSRANATIYQFLDLELRDEASAAAADDGFWSLRERIPTDVLREIGGDLLASAEPQAGDHVSAARFRTEMQAASGVRQGVEYGDAQMSAGRVGVEGSYNELEFGLTGNFTQLEADSESFGSSTPNGRTQLVSLNVSNGESSQVVVSSLTNYFGGGDLSEVDYQSHRLSWSQALGRQGRSDFSAQYTTESNFYRAGPIEPGYIPEASRALALEGSYTAPLSRRTTIQSGFRYRDLESEYGAEPLDPLTMLPEERMDFFTRAGTQLRPAVVVEYGLYSTLRDGSVSLAPRGGLMLQLGENWQATTAVSHRIHGSEESELRRDFTPSFYGESRACEEAGEHCYQVALSRSWSDDDTMSLGAVHRKYGETQKLYFDRDFYNRLESLYLVKGDVLPELQFEVTRRLAPAILAKLESSLASGGGGTFIAADERAFENSVRYLVTSLDTHFEGTDTGVFLAFHRIEQQLDPLDDRLGASYAEVEMERLQVMLTQDLGLLDSLATDLAVHLNMELSRGRGPDSRYDEDELRKRLTGGIAVKF